MNINIDMDRVKSALTRIRETETIKARDLFKRSNLAHELIGYDIVKTNNITPNKEIESQRQPIDASRRTYVSAINKGCSGFNHPDFLH